ncbi:MAG TPA: type II secretion system protein GspJ [Thermodesulfovibrionales bacterium]|nr:type II secretion system protein GspJ [Thermodesulfovibrionales bacterium]
MNSRKAGGFTLLEVLIAFAITCIVLAALYSTFFLSHRAVEAVDDSLLRLQEARSVADVTKRELEAIYSSGKYAAFKLDDRDFYGKQASQLTFTSFSPSFPGLAKITYAVEESDKKLVLKKAMISAFSKSGEAKPVELIEDLESFTVEVKSKDKWVKTWDSTLSSGLPDEMRISLNVRTRKGEVPITISDIARRRIGPL